MGYRAAFLANAGAIAAHSEAFLHALERETGPGRSLALLLAGAGNGGAHELWESVLPEGSRVRSLDINPDCARLPINVTICDVTDRDQVEGALKGDTFDVIVDSTGTCTPWLWPWLNEGGLLIVESVPDPEPYLGLAAALMRDGDSDVLPVEEIMRVNIYGPVVSIEKRPPRVVPYMTLLTGNFEDVIPESHYLDRGVKRAILAG